MEEKISTTTNKKSKTNTDSIFNTKYKATQEKNIKHKLRLSKHHAMIS